MSKKGDGAQVTFGMEVGESSSKADRDGQKIGDKQDVDSKH
jgi:hypothetical protein